MCPGKVIEGAVGNDPHGAAGGVRSLGHCIEAAIATYGNHRRIPRHRHFGGLARYLCQIGRPATQQFALSSMCCECRLDYRTLGLEVESPGGSVDHEQQRCLRVDARGRQRIALVAAG